MLVCYDLDLDLAKNIANFKGKLSEIDTINSLAEQFYEKEGETSYVVSLRYKAIRLSLDLLKELYFKAEGQYLYMTEDRKQIHPMSKKIVYDENKISDPNFKLVSDIFHTAWLQDSHDGVWYPYFNRSLSKSDFDYLYRMWKR